MYMEDVISRKAPFSPCGKSILLRSSNLNRTHTIELSGSRSRHQEEDQEPSPITLHSSWEPRRFSSMEVLRAKIAILKSSFSMLPPKLGRLSTWLMLQAVFLQEMIMLSSTVAMAVSWYSEALLKVPE